MADWTAFATAFLNRSAEEMQKGLDKAEDYEDKQRELFEQNKGVMQRRKSISDQVKNTATKLKSMGVPEEMVRAAIAQGASGILDLDRAAQSAVGKYGPAAIKDNPDVILGTSSLSPESALMVGEGALSIDDYINQTYGISQGEMGSYEAKDVGVMGRLYGVGGRDRARARLDQEAGAMGMSIYDLNQAAKGSEYESIVGGGYVQYASPKVFTVDQMSDEVNTLSTMVRGALRGNTQYQEAVTQISSKAEALQDSIKMNPSATKEHNRLRKELNEARTTKAGLEISVLQPYLQQQSSFYDLDSYQKVMGSAVDNIIGVPGFSESVFNQADPVVDMQETNADEASKPDDLKEELKEELSAPPIPGTITLDADEKTTEVYTIQDPGVLGGATVTVLERSDGTKVLRIDEAGFMAKSGAMIPAGTILDAATTGQVLSDVPSAATTGDTVEGPRPIKVDDATDTLLKSSGVDILKYLKTSGIDKRDDDGSIITAIVDWANENDKELPEDIEALLFAMRYGLDL